jgi:hypothetical protein
MINPSQDIVDVPSGYLNTSQYYHLSRLDLNEIRHEADIGEEEWEQRLEVQKKLLPVEF